MLIIYLQNVQHIQKCYTIYKICITCLKKLDIYLKKQKTKKTGKQT